VQGSGKERCSGGGRWCGGAKRTTAMIGGEMTAGAESMGKSGREGEGSCKGARARQGRRWWWQGHRGVADSKPAGAEGVRARAQRASAREMGARGRERAVAQRTGAMAQRGEEMAAQRAVQAVARSGGRTAQVKRCRQTDGTQTAHRQQAVSTEGTQMAGQSVGTGQTVVQWQGGHGVGKRVGDKGSEKAEVQGGHASAPA